MDINEFKALEIEHLLASSTLEGKRLFMISIPIRQEMYFRIESKNQNGEIICTSLESAVNEYNKL